MKIFLILLSLVIIVVAMIVVGIVAIDKPTSFDLYDKYHHGTKTPPGWDAGDWYKYKTETPIKAYDYLYWLAYGTEFDFEQKLQETKEMARTLKRKKTPNKTEDVNPFADIWDGTTDEEANPFDGIFGEEPRDEAFEALKSFYQGEIFEKFEKLKTRYYFGIGTPDGWSPSGWFNYKKEHPQKALDYLEGLANKKN